MNLDKSKPYGEIFGKTLNGARYTQGGNEFDREGKLIEKPSKEKAKPKVC